MNRAILLATGLIVLAVSPLAAVRIVSPDQAYTFAYGGVALHQLERDNSTNQLIARVTFSNRWYSGDRDERRDEQFDFHFPGLRLDETSRRYFVVDSTGQLVPAAEPQSRFPWCGYVLTPQTKIFLMNRSGRVTAILDATRQPRTGERWIELNENWSLQNLIARGLAFLVR